MLKRILLVLDTGHIADQMSLYALKLAHEHKAELMVLALIDTAALHEGEAVPAGGYALKEARDKNRADKALEEANELIEKLRLAQQAHQITFSSVILESDEPAKAVANQSTNHDLVVTTGQCLQVGSGSDKKQWLSDYLHNPPRPVLYFSPKYQACPTAQALIFAYDGSTNAARALQQYLFLAIEANNTHFQVFSHHEDRQSAERLACEAVGYLAGHGIKANPVADTTKAKPSVILASMIETQQPKLVVMGSYGHNSWRERLWGTTTQMLLTNSRAPLLIFH